MADNVTEIDGHIPNYVDPETKVPLLLGVHISLTTVALAVVALRLYTRKYIRKILTAEDWVAAASMTLCFFSTLVSCLGILGGTGLHYYDIPPGTDKSIAAATSFANQVFYQPMLQLTRISILLFYLTCLGDETRLACIGLMVLSGLFGVACTVVEFTQCNPANMLWTGVRPAEYTCIDQPQFFRISGLINLLLDLPVLGLPISVFWRLNIPQRTKVALCGIFSVGIISIGAEIMRLVIWYNTHDNNRQGKDSSWNRVTMVNVSCVEYTTAIICASLPHLKALASTIIPGYFDSAIRSLRDKRQSVRYSRQSIKLAEASSSKNTAASGSQARSQSRRSLQPPSPAAAPPTSPPPGVLNMNAMNLSGRSSVYYRHDSHVEGSGTVVGPAVAGAPGAAGAPGSAERATGKGGSLSWLADGNSEEYMLEAVQPGENEIWKKTEVEIHVGSAAVHGSAQQRESRGPGMSSWPL